MASRDLSRLIPEMQVKVSAMFVWLEANTGLKLGRDIIVTCTAREKAEQVALYAQGRESLAQVNALRKAVYLPPIGEEQNKHCVTWTLDSRHIPETPGGQVTALDVAIIKNGAATWDIKADVNHDHIPDYEEVAKAAELCGLESGARWKKPDYPHIQMPTP